MRQPGRIALLILDAAGWHSSSQVVVPENIVLLPLPPYAPELNPAENIWEYLRGNALSNCVWETYEAILDACCDAWNALMAKSNVITSIGTRKWAQVRIKAVGITGGRYARSVQLDGVQGTVAVQPSEGNALRATVRFPKLSALPAIIARLRRVFD